METIAKKLERSPDGEWVLRIYCEDRGAGSMVLRTRSRLVKTVWFPLVYWLVRLTEE